MITLIKIKRTESELKANMASHYSQPKGFVGRNICYEVRWDGHLYGHIVGGSSTLHLPGRDEFFGIPKANKEARQYLLRRLVNNIFFHIEPKDGVYPVRNFSQKVIRHFRNEIKKDWKEKYGESIFGFETLVELPRTGLCYKQDNWIQVGQTEGFTCKRVAGKGTDNWTGKRIWDTKNLRPKLVFCRYST